MVNITSEMKFGTVVTFKYANNLITGVINEQRGVHYVVDVATINGVKQEFKTVTLINASIVINYLLNK